MNSDFLRTAARIVLVAPVFLVFGCSSETKDPAMVAPSSILTIHIESSDFKEGQPIPKEFTGEGADKSPALKWSGASKNAKSLALICDDPDAPRKDPWVHWVLYNIPAGTTELPQNLAKSEKLDEPKGAIQGTNDFKKIGYNGPMPPPGHGVHHYHFKIYALDSDLNLKPGASKSELLAAMKDHIVGEGELVGTYERK